MPQLISHEEVQEKMKKIPEWEFNGIGDMQPGEGYQVKMLDEDILNY